MSRGRLMQGRGWRSSPDLSVCLLFGICSSTQRDRFNLLIALCVSGNFSDLCLCVFLCVNLLCESVRADLYAVEKVSEPFAITCIYILLCL